MRTFLFVIAAAMAVVGTLRGSDTTSAAPSAPVRVTLVQAQCEADGSVSGLITVQNITDNKVTYEVPLVLTQHIPPSREGEPKFDPVLGANTVVVVNLAGEAVWGFDYGPLNTSAVDPQANSLRVEVDVDADSTLNWDKSESFPSCGVPIPTPTPEPTPTLGPTPTATPEPTPTPTPVIGTPWSAPPEATATPMPTPKVPTSLPVTGSEPPATRYGDVIGWELALVGVAVLALIGFAHKVWPRPFRRR